MIDESARIERLERAVIEAAALLNIAYFAHQKLGLEGRGNSGLAHETRIFAMHFSDAETPKTPMHTMLKGDGRYWAWRLGLKVVLSASDQDVVDLL